MTKPYIYTKPPPGSLVDPEETINSGLAWLPMNEGVGSHLNDISGNHNVGALVANTAWVGGRTGAALSFDGVANTVGIANLATLQFERTDVFSVSTMVFPRSVTGAFLSNQTAAAPFRGYELRVDGGLIRVIIRSDNAPSDQIIVEASDVITTGSWYSICFTYDGSSSGSGVVLYVDGNVRASGVDTDTLSATIVSGVPLYLGSRANTSNWLTGDIDEVRIWNRILTASDAQQLSTMQFKGIK